MIQEFIIDLGRPPEERWTLSESRCSQSRQLTEVYTSDLGVLEDTANVLCEMAQSVIPENYWREFTAIAELLNVPVASIFVCNAYYDLIKSVLGCTAFAVETDDGPIHARNLDWWTRNGLLSDASFACRFIGAPAGEFVSIGWPGFTGVLSGMAPGRFSITLNAVLGNDPMEIALPVSHLLRSVFENAATFDAAIEMLCNAIIPSDCLLLVSGTKAGELVVIERSPTQHAVRHPDTGSSIVVANDYLVLNDGFRLSGSSELQVTSSGRYSRMMQLLGNPPQCLDGCIAYLSDPSVQMSITVQQMAFSAQSGEYIWRKA